MAPKYLLSCGCGRQHTVEVSQAGGDIPCDCGQRLRIPRMLELKKLPVDTSLATSPAASTAGASRSPRKIVMLVGWTWGGVFLLLALAVFAFPPKLEEAILQRTVFTYGGQKVRQNVIPISAQERFNALASDERIEYMAPVESWWYWQYLQEGVAPSFALRTRYDSLKQRYWLWVAGLTSLAMIGIITGGSATLLGGWKPKRVRR